MTKQLQWIIGICMLVFTTAVTVPLVYMWPVARRVEVASQQLLECKGNAACLQSQSLAIVGSVKATAGAIAKAAPEISSAIRGASDTSVAASRQTVAVSQAATELLTSATGATEELHAAIKDFRGTVAELNISIKDLTAGADVLLKSSDTSIQAAGAALVKLGVLEDELDQQVKAAAPEAIKTLEAMHALFEDPALLGMLTNMDNGTHSLAEVANTFDIATRPLRKKASQIKWLIDKLIGLVKFTVPLL